ncbi:MAG: hypothetical protein ACI837_002058 [Crocinitomicaceae bacterium]|jgi:hypothetical protein
MKKALSPRTALFFMSNSLDSKFLSTKLAIQCKSINFELLIRLIKQIHN